jgi:F0F1-type ATP synthase assembly protein I
MKQTKAPELTPSPSQANKADAVADSKNTSQVFVSMAVDMSWRLAIAVLVPVIIGAELYKHNKDNALYLLSGLLVAIILAVVVIKRSYDEANSLSVSAKGKKNVK